MMMVPMTMALVMVLMAMLTMLTMLMMMRRTNARRSESGVSTAVATGRQPSRDHRLRRVVDAGGSPTGRCSEGAPTFIAWEAQPHHALRGKRETARPHYDQASSTAGVVAQHS